MSLEGDMLMFENSMSSHSDVVPFSEKKINFITDSSNGQFQSGQVQFDLSTFSSQNYNSLSEGLIEMPLKITVQITQAGSGGTPGNASASALSVICKNGFHQWINSAQLIINGQTIQSAQPYENVAASYRILSKWSQDTLQKWGKTCNIALDDCTGDSTVSTTYSTGVGLNNASTSTVFDSIKGFDSTNNQSVLFNKGTIDRGQLLNTNSTTGLVAYNVLGSSGIINSGKSNVAVSSSSNTANTYLYTQFIMATIRVKDLFDIDTFPLTKNLKGYIYLNFNSFSTTLTSSAGAALGTVTYTPLTGQTCPYSINYSNTGIQLNSGGSGLTTNQIVTVVGTVDASSTNKIGTSGPVISTARLILPYYVADPRTDAALSKVVKFKSLEKIVNPFTMSSGETKNYTLTVGCPNPRKLVLLPMLQNLGGTSNLLNPEQSAFDQTPATSGPFAKLDNLMVYIANKPLFQYPIQYDFEFWASNANVSDGLNSGLTDEMSSGLLTQQLWEQNHRYYAIDLSRRLESDNGMSRSVQITCTNATTYGMKVIAILFYEKQWEINTATCQIQNA